MRSEHLKSETPLLFSVVMATALASVVTSDDFTTVEMLSIGEAGLMHACPEKLSFPCKMSAIRLYPPLLTLGSFWATKFEQRSPVPP